MAVSLIVAVRNWPIDRVLASNRSYAALSPDDLAEIIVVDFGSERPVADAEGNFDARTRVVRVEADDFSLAEATNIGVLHATSELICKTDADIIFHPASLHGYRAAVRAVESGEVDLSLTQVWDVPVELSSADGSELSQLLLDGDTLGAALRPRQATGGWTIFSKRTWAEVGGYEARYTGWGSEDNDFVERLRLAGKRARFTPRDALRLYHLPHPPTSEKRTVALQYAKNRVLKEIDQSVRRRLSFPHSHKAVLKSPQLRTALPPHVTLAIATSGREGRARMISEALMSFRGQIDNDFEVVVVDNGSTAEEHSEMRRALRAIDFAPVHFEQLPTRSIPVARNLATSIARGRYICVVDDDDLALPDRLSDHLACFDAGPMVHGSHGGWIDFDETTGQIERYPGGNRNLAHMLFNRGGNTAHPASFYRTDVLRAMPYDESFTLGSDYDLAIRMARMELNIAHTGSYVTLRRYHAGNVTLVGAEEQRSGGGRARVRTLAGLSKARRKQLQGQVAKTPAPRCRHSWPLSELALYLPDYAGRWCLLLDASVLGIAAPGQPKPVPRVKDPAKVLTSLVAAAEGELTTLTNGVAQPIYWRSRPIDGLKELLKLKMKAEAVVRMPLSMISAAQLEADRAEGFPWSQLGDGLGAVFLRSDRFSDLSEALFACSKLGQNTLLASALTMVSDRDDEGECYYLMSNPLTSAAAISQVKFMLEPKTGARFLEIGERGQHGNAFSTDRWH